MQNKTAKCAEQLSPPDVPCAPEMQLSSSRPAPSPEPSMMARGIEYPVLFGQFGSASQAVSPSGFW